MANLLNLFNPAVVAFGGAITGAGELFLGGIKETVKERTLWEAVSDAQFVVSSLGEKCIAIGAATQVLKATLNDMSLFPIVRELREEKSRSQRFSFK